MYYQIAEWFDFYIMIIAAAVTLYIMLQTIYIHYRSLYKTIDSASVDSHKRVKIDAILIISTITLGTVAYMQQYAVLTIMPIIIILLAVVLYFDAKPIRTINIAFGSDKSEYTFAKSIYYKYTVAAHLTLLILFITIIISDEGSSTLPFNIFISTLLLQAVGYHYRVHNEYMRQTTQ